MKFAFPIMITFCFLRYDPSTVAAGPIRTYPGPLKSEGGSHRVEEQIHRTRHIRYRQLMLEMRHKSEGTIFPFQDPRK